MYAAVSTVLVHVGLFVGGTAQNSCPAGFSVEVGATGGIFATENSTVAARVRCTSIDYTNRQVYEHIGTLASCSGSDGDEPLCIARRQRCTAADHDVFVVGSKEYCLSCDAGSTKSGQICSNCAAGKYRQVHTANVCQTCAVGKASQEGSTRAEDCDDDDCQFCARGSYTANEGSTSCELCTTASVAFETTAGQPHCTACPANASSVCTVQQFVMRIDANDTATSGSIYSGYNNSVWFQMDNKYTSLRHILNSMRQHWNPGAQLFIASAIGQPQILNPTVLMCMETGVYPRWSPSNVNPVHSSNATRYVLLSKN